MPRTIDLIGKKFGHLLVNERMKDHKGFVRYLCICDCEKIHSVLRTHLVSGKITHCGCQRSIGANHQQWKGVGDISGAFWYDKVVRSASGVKGNRRTKELSITIEEAWNLFQKQGGKCALSGIPLYFPEKSKGDYTASLDRIDSTKEYSIENVQWVHKHINIMKNKFPNQYFINMCKNIANCAGGACELN